MQELHPWPPTAVRRVFSIGRQPNYWTMYGQGTKRGDGSSRQPHMQGRMRCQGGTQYPGKHTIDAQHLEAFWKVFFEKLQGTRMPLSKSVFRSYDPGFA